MEPSPVLAFPGPDAGHDGAALADRALTEIDVAIALVESQVARRVRLTALPFVETVAAIGLAHAREAGMAFTYERSERVGVATVTVGPVRPVE